MAISEFEEKRCEREMEKFMELRRPAPHIRKDFDLGYRIHNQSVEIFEIRPEWKNPASKIEIPVAKATYVKTQGCWKIYWQRQDMKWHSYKPQPEVSFFEDFLSVVNEDFHGCFFG